MLKKRIPLYFLTLLMTASLFSGCGSKSSAPTQDSSQKSADTKEQSVDPQAKSVQEITPAQKDAEYEEWMYIAFQSEPDNANPYGSIGPAKDVTAFSTFEMLTYLDVDTHEIQGVLAKEWKDVNGDGKKWEIKLREGVKFHSGTEMTAEDVKFTWDYAGSGGTGQVVQPIASYKYVDNIEVVDKYTVNFNLKSSVYDFPTYLETMILSKEAYDTLPKEEAELIGTGPYHYNAALRKPGVEWVITRFEDYHGGLEDHPTKNICFRVLPDVNTQIASLQAGEIDLVPDIAASYYDMLKADPNIALQIRPSALVYYLGFNYHNRFDEVKDLKLREAMAYALNKDAVISIAFNNGVGAVVTDNFCPPTGLGYSKITSKYSYNPDKAKEILTEFGYSPSNPLKLTVATYAPQIAEVIQAGFAEVGIQLTLTQVDMSNWSSYKKAGEGYDIFIDYAGYRGALMYNFDRFFAKGGSAGALFGYSSDEYQALQDKAMAASSYEEMLKEFTVLQQWVADNLPLYPMLIKTAIAAQRSDVEGFNPSISNDRTNVSHVRALKRK